MGVGAGVIRPLKVECVTAEHTFCPNHVAAPMGRLETSSLLLAPRQYDEIEAAMRQAEPTFVSVEFKRTVVGGILAIVEFSPEVLTVQVDQDTYSIRANGLMEKTDKTVQPPLILTDPDQQLSEEQIKLLVKLYEQYRHFSPRVTKMTYISQNEIRLSLEGKNPIIVRADEEAWLDRQLAALQAFFRSSTMAEEYQELDARFSDLVVKE